MLYRAEIDGLRAVAVIPVILFHAGFGPFQGGFVGVDVFFVISGYLITNILLNEMGEERFSLIHFYERRARRILPALLFVMFVCLVFAWIWLLPRDLLDFAQSLAAVATFSSNILFWFESGYFDTSSELKPLLHTWSLAVEEQYYILFPLFLLLTWRLGRVWVLILLVFAFVGSLGLAQWSAYYKPAAAFYLLPSRGWEILIGVFAAFYLQKRPFPAFSIVTQGASALGVLMIGYAIFAYGEQTPFPGFYALVPTLGTVLIILCAVEGTAVRALLSTKILVGIGLISYSAYLWHQPLYAFAKYRSSTELSEPLMLGIGLLTFPLAYFTWRYVERPFRVKNRFSRRKVFTVTGIGLMFFLTTGLFAHFNVDLLRKWSPVDVLPVEREPVPANFAYRMEGADREAVLWGDSYAGVLAHAVGLELNQHGISMIRFTQASCPSVLGVLRNEDERLGAGFGERCEAFNEDALKEILAIKPEFVILTSAYGRYLNEKNWDDEPLLIDPDRPDSEPSEYLSQRLLSTMDVLWEHGIQPILVTPPPAVSDFETILRTGFFLENPVFVDVKTAQDDRATLMKAWTDSETRIRVVDSAAVLCDSSRESCSPFLADGGESYLWYDGHHLSPAGAGLVAHRIMDLMR